MKVAPVLRSLRSRGSEQLLVHTGQHYDANMSTVFFDELDLPRPDVDLEVGSGSHAWQTGEVMKRLEPVLLEHKPGLLMVYGDINSTMAAALTACKLQVLVAHVEAGLRSFDRTMPEETNRIVTDHVSDLLLTHCSDANQNLAREGIDPSKVHLVGNVMIDSLVRLLPKARTRGILHDLNLMDGNQSILPFVLVTLHRPSNVDCPERLLEIVHALNELAKTCPIVFPVHPRTRERIAQSGIDSSRGHIQITQPLGYLDFLCLENRARAVVTDSGGVQEETTYLGVSCFTLRPNTERPVTITCGTNKLVSGNLDGLASLVRESVQAPPRVPKPPAYWDGRAAERISEVVLQLHG